MSTLQQTTEVTTIVQVELSLKLQKTLKQVLTEYRELKLKSAAIDGELDTHKRELEMLFVDADQYEALENGVRITTPFGEVPLKIVKGDTAPKLDEVKLMKKFKLTPKDLDSCRTPGKPKKPYLGIYLPKEKNETGDDK